MLHKKNRWVSLSPSLSFLSLLPFLPIVSRTFLLLSFFPPIPCSPYKFLLPCAFLRFPIHGRKESDVRKLLFGGFEAECIISIQTQGSSQLQDIVVPRMHVRMHSEGNAMLVVLCRCTMVLKHSCLICDQVKRTGRHATVHRRFESFFFVLQSSFILPCLSVV